MDGAAGAGGGDPVDQPAGDDLFAATYLAPQGERLRYADAPVQERQLAAEALSQRSGRLFGGCSQAHFYIYSP
jgi:hypothetical protein